MKRIGITQRVVLVERINERRDVLDQRWHDFAECVGIILVPIPNKLKNTSAYVESLNLDGLIFSGGNNIGLVGKELIEGKSIEVDDVAYERDLTESRLIEWSVQQRKPIIGVCRGLQLINAYYKGGQISVSADSHVAKVHNLSVIDEKYQRFYGKGVKVNSYHRWGITRQTLAINLVPGALYRGEQVEAFYHREFPLYGIMWHPERYEPFYESDLKFFKGIFEL